MSVTQLTKSGGTLEYLFANLFPALSQTNKSEGDPTVLQAQRAQFIVSPSTLASVQLAIHKYDEDALATFLKTGSVAAPTSESSAPMTRKAVLASTIEASRFKVEELMLLHPPSAVTQPPPLPMHALPQPIDQSSASSSAPPATSSSTPTTLSKESKMEMWKRITEERRARERLQLNAVSVDAISSYRAQDPSTSAATVNDTPPLLSVARPIAMETRTEQRAPELPHSALPSPPPPPPPPSPPSDAIHSETSTVHAFSRFTRASPPLATRSEALAPDSVRTGHGAVASSSSLISDANPQSVATHVKALAEQVAAMRKYMKV